MRKFGVFVLFLVVAMAAAGLFGMFHDQISYTVSDEYFTKFKFFQFHLLNTAVPERVRVAGVGFLASWWMGIPIGLLAGVVGFIHPTAAQMWRALLLSLIVMSAFTLIFALCGLLYGYVHTEHLETQRYVSARWLSVMNIQYPRNFICVGYMHNSAYLGGLLAVPLAWFFHVYYREAKKRDGGGQ